MKILILTSYRDSWAYIPDFIAYLRSQDITADVLDLFNFEFVGKSRKRYYAGEFRDRIFKRLPLLGRVMKILLFPFFYWRYARPIITQYDLVNIHFVSTAHRFIIPLIKSKSIKLIVTVWGSDFLRVGDQTRRKIKILFDAAQAITFLNPQVAKQCIDYYGEYGNKISILHFGLRSIDTIQHVMSSESRELSREKSEIPEVARVITIGYNGSSAQQHLRILSQISKIRLPADAFLLLPMTYGLTTEYKSVVEKKLRHLSRPYRIIDTMVAQEDIARLRIASDIVINFQKTDQLSASLQEHLYVGNVVIVADWLPYDIFQKQGIFFITASWQSLPETLNRVIEKFSDFTKQARHNQDPLYEFGSWRSNGPQWIALYEKMLSSYADSRP